MSSLLVSVQVANIIWLDMNKGLVYFADKEIGAGLGNNGQVFHGYVGYNTNKAEKCAVKIINKPKQAQLAKQLELELILCRKLKHKNIVNFYECTESQNNFYIFMDVCEGGSLQDMMNLPGREDECFETKKMPEDKALEIISQIIDGLYYMKKVVVGNTQGIYHRDIKPDNIMFKNRIPKLIDFGMGKYKANTNTYYKGSPIYMSPQNLNSQPYNLEKNDVWSVGIILYQLVEGFYPWRVELNDLEDLRNAQNSLKISIQFTESSPQLQKLLKHMLQYDQNKRADWDDVIKYEVLSKYFYGQQEQLNGLNNLIQSYNRFEDLKQQLNITCFDKITTDLFLLEINKYKNVINQNSEQDLMIKNMYLKRMQQKRKNCSFKRKVILKQKLQQKLERVIQHLIINQPPINYLFFASLVQMMMQLFFEKQLQIEQDDQGNEGLIKLLQLIK